jgi:hypothetical protein
MVIGPFNSKDVLEYQIRKNTGKGLKLTGQRNKIREHDISLIKKFFPEIKSILCVGCRTNDEVKSFLKHNYFFS